MPCAVLLDEIRALNVAFCVEEWSMLMHQQVKSVYNVDVLHTFAEEWDPRMTKPPLCPIREGAR